MKYDLIIIGAGLYGCVCAYEATKRGLKVLVADRRNHIGGNCYTKDVDGINVHQYGAHIFRTSKKETWDYIRQFAKFNHFVNSPVAVCKGKLYNLPFNMNTFYQMWGVKTPDEARAIIDKQRQEIKHPPKNLEEQAISLVGRDIYEILIREYTEKQWGRPCDQLPASILRRLPVRLTFDNNYYRDPYQGIPIGGFTRIFEKMLAGCDVRLGIDHRAVLQDRGNAHVIFTGAIDEYFDYCCGPLEYRSLRFEHERHDETGNLQGVAVMNYNDLSVPYTRTVEHKHFEFGSQPFTIISKEYPLEWKPGTEPYYPINDAKNQARYKQYATLAKQLPHMTFGGRLGSYSYTDMQDTIANALTLSDQTI